MSKKDKIYFSFAGIEATIFWLSDVEIKIWTDKSGKEQQFSTQKAGLSIQRKQGVEILKAIKKVQIGEKLNSLIFNLGESTHNDDELTMFVNLKNNIINDVENGAINRFDLIKCDILFNFKNEDEAVIYATMQKAKVIGRSESQITEEVSYSFTMDDLEDKGEIEDDISLEPNKNDLPF